MSFQIFRGSRLTDCMTFEASFWSFQIWISRIPICFPPTEISFDNILSILAGRNFASCTSTNEKERANASRVKALLLALGYTNQSIRNCGFLGRVVKKGLVVLIRRKKSWESFVTTQEKAEKKAEAVRKRQEAKRLKAEAEATAKRLKAEIKSSKKLLGDSLNPLVEIPSGEFMMGALPNDSSAGSSEKPRHKVRISRDFLIGKYAVTQALYESIMGENPSDFQGSMRPVENVSWCDAVLFCNKLSEKEGLESVYTLPEPFENDNDWSTKVKINLLANGYRLPTEAEWEYACRGGEEHLHSGSDNLDEVGWSNENSNGETHPVGQKKANGFGLYDMSGNVWEWVWDKYGKYSSSSKTDPVGAVESSYRVSRGGSWLLSARCARVSLRNNSAPSYRNLHFGFRVFRVAE